MTVLLALALVLESNKLLLHEIQVHRATRRGVRSGYPSQRKKITVKRFLDYVVREIHVAACHPSVLSISTTISNANNEE
jgi:hypothetical protein